MKLALIFLTIFVAISHQQNFHPRMMFGFPWMSPFSQEPLDVNEYVNEETYPGFMRLSSRNGIVQDEQFADVQSRIKGFSSNFNGLSRYRPSPSFNDQQNARFFFNLANTASANNNGIFNYLPFLKTATFTLTSTLTLASIVSCAPANNFDPAVAVPPACRRKRSEGAEEDQFPITPSETISVMPTTISTPHDRSLDILSSSRDDFSDELSSAYPNLREKRFFYGNKNLFVVSSTLTTYAFVNTTVTVTVNLLNPAPVAPAVCVPDAVAAAAAGAIQCVACLPAGLIVCPAPAG